jgi:hypothetical protein
MLRPFLLHHLQWQTLLHQLTLRFGPLSERVTARVRAGIPVELVDWTGRVLTVPTLEAVFAHG